MTGNTRTVIFWGAGATATLGMRTTVQQATFLRRLTGVANESGAESLRRRVGLALGCISARWIEALVDLLTILGDEGGEEPQGSRVSEDQMVAMRRNWSSEVADEEIRVRILELRKLYDWTALKAVVKVCPAERESDRASGTFLTDLLNILDVHSQSGHGFPVQDELFLTPRRVANARNALKVLLQTLFYVDWQELQSDERKKAELELHYDFATVLGRRMQRQGVEKAQNEYPFDNRDFYMGDVSFASLNYDPVALWLQYVANRDLNKGRDVPYVGSPRRRLQLFHDLSHLVPSRRVRERNPRTPWHPMNEAAAQRLNDLDHGATDCIRITKFLFPHGCLSWRECPSCGKLSSYVGNQWDKNSRVVIPPPPLKAFVQNVQFPYYDEKEKKEWDSGGVDARACVHCNTLSYAHDTQIVMQSNFKSAPPPFIEEIQRDLRVIVQDANHIVFMGYSLPRDDVNYRAIFAVRRRYDPERPVKCSVVVGNDSTQNRWLGPSDLSDLNSVGIGAGGNETLEAAIELFGSENVRFYGGGIPGVFLDGGTVTESAVEGLLNWNRTG